MYVHVYVHVYGLNTYTYLKNDLKYKQAPTYYVHVRARYYVPLVHSVLEYVHYVRTRYGGTIGTYYLPL